MLDQSHFDPAELRAAFGCFPTGVTAVTMRDDAGAPTGVTVSSFSSLSLSPPLCVFSLVRTQMSCRWITAREAFVINVLGAEQEATAVQFARPQADKFAGVAWSEGANGMPVIEGSLAHFECRTWATYDGGDHILVVGEITDFHRDFGAALVHCRGTIAALPE